MNDYQMVKSLNDLNSCLNVGGWDRAMLLGSFQCRGVLLLWYMVGQGPAVLAGCFFVCLFHLMYPILVFLMPHLLGDGWTY